MNAKPRVAKITQKNLRELEVKFCFNHSQAVIKSRGVGLPPFQIVSAYINNVEGVKMHSENFLNEKSKDFFKEGNEQNVSKGVGK